MALSYDTWETDLENAIAQHIIDTLDDVGEDVKVYIEREIKPPFEDPVITLAHVDGTRENTGGMNVVSDTQQGHWYTAEFFLTVNTDTRSGKKAGRNKIWSLLNTISFGQQLHVLLAAIDGISVTIEDRGNAVGPSGTDVWYQKQGMLRVRCLVAFTSVTI